VRKADFSARTGLPWREVESLVGQALEAGLLMDKGEYLSTSNRGWQHLNTLQEIFL